MKHLTRISLCFALSFCAQWAVADDQKQAADTKQAADDEVKLSEKEQAFQDLLTKAKLLGKFTVDGQDASKLAEEEYTISRISKTPEKDLWVFMARVKYGDNDYTVPLTLTVKWADDTPMITLTDLKILGQGPFSARVLFHDKKYAGTWSHGEVGGHLFGRIEKAEPKDKQEEK